MMFTRSKYPLLTCLLVMLSLPVQSQTETGAQEEENLPFGLGWLEDTQRISSNQANALANQIDRFFGVPQSDLEAAYSSLRLSLNNEWIEAEGTDHYFRLRGRLYLPRINERISLVFSDDEGEGEDVYNPDPTGAEPKNTRVNVEVKLNEQERSRLDFRVGLRSSLKLRASMRYRYTYPVGETWTHGLTQTFQFVDGDGFGSLSRSELNKAVNETTLIRITNDIRLEENIDGAEIRSEVRLIKRVKDQSAFSVFGRIDGETKPDFVSAYTTGLRYRQAIYKTWLFAELEPQYTWFKENADDRREGQYQIVLRVEMAIGHQE